MGISAMPDYRGQRFGNYELLTLLGEGGFAQVYLGEQVFLKTRAAIKILHAQLDDEKVEQFRLEASMIAGLDHPHIVRLLDYGVEKGTPYLIMAYASNGSLRQRHPAGMPVPLPIVIRYVQQIASALDYAHQQRIIHRDVKPENLLLGRQNDVLLSDFGIAIVAHQTTSMSTQDGVGTISYVAPEQLRRRPHPSSDQYALAAVVYEWLTGNVPFQGTPIEVAMQHLETPPPPMRGPGSPISAEVERVVMRALEKHWQMRYASVRDFALALQEAHSPHPPFVRVSEAAPSPDEFDLLDLEPTTPSPLPTITPGFAGTALDQLPDQETLKLNEPTEKQAPDEAAEVRSPEAATPPSGGSRPPGFQRPGTRRQTRRNGALALGALLLVALLGVGSLLWALTSAPVGTHGGPLSATQTQQTQHHATPTPGVVGSTPTAPGQIIPSPTGAAGTPTPRSSPTPTTIPPQILVNPTSLTFSFQLVNCLTNNKQTLYIQNTGSGTLSWQASIQSPAFLSIDPSSGTISDTTAVPLKVSASCSLSTSETDTIYFTSNGGNAQVTVTINLL
jgi:serine/threonine protein kinase